MTKVIKRDCTEVDFDKSKISAAIMKAMRNGSGIMKPKIAENIADEIYDEFKDKEEISISEIEEKVYEKLIAKKQKLTAKAYEGYRSIREFQRENFNTTDEEIEELLTGTSDYWSSENSNKDEKLTTTQRDYMAGIVSKDMTRRFLLPPEVVQAHDEGMIHFHDMDYFGQHSHNCDLVNLDDMLQNGTVISGTLIEKPHSFSTACNIATQIIAQVASSQYGGQTITLSHLAPFVDVSRQKIRKEVIKEMKLVDTELSDEQISVITEKRLKDEINKGVQTIQYQVVTLLTTNGQAPFLSVGMYLGEVEDEQAKEDLALIIEEVLRQRIEGVKNEKGVWITPAFPKLLYVLEEDNIHEDSKYWYLTELAAKCTAKRMVPDYISEKKMLEYKGECYMCMGCRSFLTPWRTNKNISRALNYDDSKGKYYGRFNCGVVTLNLPDIALSSGGDIDTFWEIFEERMELCHKALKARHNRLLGTSSNVAPILWQYGALARLDKGEKIDSLLYDGYSTISLGYVGLYECVKYMTGHSHTDGDIGEKFGLEVMQALNDKCNEWKTNENIDYSVYGSPCEAGVYKFAKCLQKRFGIIDGITDRDYITNSYHVPVFEEIDPFEKLRIESKFQKLSPGGAISYIECADLTNNTEAVLEVMKFIYDNIMYAELNTKSDYCQVCGYDGEIKIIDEDGELIWECPNCKNRDKNKMNVSRRTCGKPNDNIATIQNSRNSREVRSYNTTDNLEPSLEQYTLNNIFDNKKNFQYKCDFCGRPLFKKIKAYGHIYCPKHYNQFKRHGKVLDSNPRTSFDKNEIHVCGKTSYIDLYDKNYNVIAQAIIDTDDIPKVRYTKWKLSNSGYVMNTSKFSGSNKHMSREILQTDQFVDPINHNTLDNRKSNLRIVTKSQNQMNSNYKGVSDTKDGRYYAHIKIDGKMYNLGVYIDKEEAYYARWYAEKILFKEYRYPKEKPFILKDREQQIEEYVTKKVC